MNGDGIRTLVAAREGQGSLPGVDALERQEDLALDSVADLDALVDVLDGDDCPSVVLTGPNGVDGDWSRVVDRVRSADPYLPVILIDTEASGERASTATARGGVQYVAAGQTDGALVERVERAIDRYETIRRQRAESGQLRSMLDRLPYSIYIKDDQARFLAVSKHLRETIGADPAGKTDLEIWGTDGAGDAGRRSYADDLQVTRTGEPVLNRIERVTQADGNELMLLTSKVPWYDADGEVGGVLGISIDITESKREEEQLRQTTERLERFTSFVSNDLRNPINVAQGFLEHSLATGDPEALDRVGQALEHMETLVDDLLTVASDEDIEPELVPLTPLVERTWRSAPTAYLTLELSIPDDTYIYAVPGQLRQLLDNLYRNAADHAGPAVTVRVGLTRTGFFVEDDGDGIPEHRRDRLFDYGDADAGTGIGLAIVKEIANTHGWRPEVTESPTGGARFEFHDCIIHRGLPEQHNAGDPLELDECTDVGQATPSGDHAWGPSRDAVTLAGGGQNLYGDIDQHYFHYAEVEGNARIEARIHDLEGPHEFSKAGVMLRAGPAAGSPLVFVGQSRDRGSETIIRPGQGERIRSEQYERFDETPRWYRIDWIDHNVLCQTSVDGEDWTTLERRPVDVGEPIALGLAACSHDPTDTVEAQFDHVRTVELDPTTARLGPSME